jgi:hypothetical protein
MTKKELIEYLEANLHDSSEIYCVTANYEFDKVTKNICLENLTTQCITRIGKDKYIFR